MRYDVLVLSRELSTLGEHIIDFFRADYVSTSEQALEALCAKKYKVLVQDVIKDSCREISQLQEYLPRPMKSDVPTVLLVANSTITEKVKAFELGYDDCIESCVGAEETCARITKSIFHKIAHSQLSQRLAKASEKTWHTLEGNAGLNADIDFLLNVQECDNLDQLGQLLFAAIEGYGLVCSLQMRSEMGTKDMEAHGMAKNLESQLLIQMRDKGQFVDFGRRTIINCEKVSLLIKNMPVDNSLRIDALKNNVIRLLKGVNLRIIALEQRFKLSAEKEQMRRFTLDVQESAKIVMESYKEALLNISNEIDSVAEKIQHRLHQSALEKDDEQFVGVSLEHLKQKVTSTSANELLKKSNAKMENLLHRRIQAG